MSSIWGRLFPLEGIESPLCRKWRSMPPELDGMEAAPALGASII